MRLKELADNIKNQKQQKKQDVPKKKTLPNHDENADGTFTSERSKNILNSGSHEDLDGMWDMSCIYMHLQYKNTWKNVVWQVF